MTVKRAAFKRHDTFISFDLRVDNLRGKKHLQYILDAIISKHGLKLSTPQMRALTLIVLNAINYQYKPLIITLNNNSTKIKSRYNHSGVGINAFRNVYRTLELKKLIYTRFAAFPSATAQESTVIEVDGLRYFCRDHERQILRYLKEMPELVVLRKTTKQHVYPEGKFQTKRNSTNCEYSDTNYSHQARNFLKQYNRWIAQSDITFDIHSANRGGLFRMSKYKNLKKDELQAYIFTYFRNLSLRRIYSAPTSYNPIVKQPLPRRGGRFYGGFWQDQLPSDFRKYLLINGQPCVELDFRAMNLTMLLMAMTGQPWTTYPYENIPLPGNPTITFPKALVKPFFTWCLNVPSKASAIMTLRKELPKELSDNGNSEHIEFLSNHDLTYSQFIDSMLDSQPSIRECFFIEEPIGMKLQFYDSEIIESVMRRCMEFDIYCLPIHDALLVQERHKDVVKGIMARELCNYFDAPLREEYIETLIKETLPN